MTIVNIRGTHGSGKSTLVSKLVEELALPQLTEKGKIIGHCARGIYVVGKYTIATGGADSIQPYSRILPYIIEARRRGMHVIYEGALVSSSFGSIGQWLLDNCLEESIILTLNTPVDKCIERVNNRRAARGVPPLESNINIVNKHESVRRAHLTFKDRGFDARVVTCAGAYKIIRSLVK